MSKFIYKNRAEHKGCWLRDHIDSYLIHLRVDDCSQQVVQSCEDVLVGFALFTGEQGVEQVDQLHEWAESFAEHESNPTPKESTSKIIADFIGYLQKTGVLPKCQNEGQVFLENSQRV